MFSAFFGSGPVAKAENMIRILPACLPSQRCWSERRWHKQHWSLLWLADLANKERNPRVLQLCLGISGPPVHSYWVPWLPHPCRVTASQANKWCIDGKPQSGKEISEAQDRKEQDPLPSGRNRPIEERDLVLLAPFLREDQSMLSVKKKKGKHSEAVMCHSFSTGLWIKIFTSSRGICKNSNWMLHLEGGQTKCIPWHHFGEEAAWTYAKTWNTSAGECCRWGLGVRLEAWLLGSSLCKEMLCWFCCLLTSVRLSGLGRYLLSAQHSTFPWVSSWVPEGL